MARQNEKAQPQKTSAQKEPEIRVYDVLSPHSYEHRGEKKTGWTEVGTAWPSKDKKGVNVEIKPGLSVSGRLVLRVRNRNESKDDDGSPKRFSYVPNSDDDDLI